MVETKANAEAVAKLLDERLVTPRPLRIHWTGCPNSCGQVQAADIGIMGGPAKKFDPESGKNKAVPGCNIFLGGTIGENAHLSLEPAVKGVPLEHDILVPKLEELIIEHFGGTPRPAPSAGAGGLLAKVKALFRRD
uniref:Ferredoxin--nitrite reductase, chloroplastic n=2 Tax=Emiliania huxleyi TaxID=2903 RepID=A0A7S3WUJ4_EMIHU